MTLPTLTWPRHPALKPRTVGFSKYGLEFGGADYVAIPDAIRLAIGDSLAYQAWFRAPTVPHHMGIIQIYEDWLENALHMRTDPVLGCLQAAFTDAGTGVAVTVNTLNGYADGLWHQVVAQIDGSIAVNNIEIIVDGVLDNMGSLDVTTVLQFTGTNSAIGRMLGNPGVPDWFYWEHLLDEVAIYDRPLTLNEVRQNILNYHNIVDAGLVAWYRMEEGDGLTVEDLSGNGYDGTLTPAGAPPAWRENQKWELREEVSL